MTPQELKNSILNDAFTGKFCELTKSKDFGGIDTLELPEPPFDIPETWVWSTLGLCCEMYTGNSIPETVKASKYAGLKTGYDYIATKDVTFQQKICYDNGVRIPYNDGFKVASKGSVLMCIEGGSAGRKIGMLDRDVCFGNKLCSFYSKGVGNKYIFYYLQSLLFKELFSGGMTGIIGGVSIKKLKGIPIPIAPLAEQKRIVAKIEELLPYIDRYEKAWSKLEQFNSRFPDDLKKSLLQHAIQGKLVEQRAEEGTAEELFAQIQKEKQRLIAQKKIKKEKPLPPITDDEKPFDIPESWKWVRLGEISTYNYQKEKISANEITEDMWSLDLEDIEKESGEIINICKASERKISGDKVKFYKGQVLYSKLRPYLKKILVAPDDGICSSEMVPFNLYGNIDAQYAVYFLKSPNVDFIINSVTYGVKMPRVGTDTMIELPFPLPPLAEQKRIVEKLEQLLPLCERLK